MLNSNIYLINKFVRTFLRQLSWKSIRMLRPLVRNLHDYLVAVFLMTPARLPI